MASLVVAFAGVTIAEWGYVTALAVSAYRHHGAIAVGLIGLRLFFAALGSIATVSFVHRPGVGRELGCGAFLTALRRTAAGEFTETGSHTLDHLEEIARNGIFDQALIPLSSLLPDIPNATVDALTAGQIRHGKDFRLSPFVDRAASKYVKALSAEGDLIAIGEVRLPNLYHPVLVL